MKELKEYILCDSIYIKFNNNKDFMGYKSELWFPLEWGGNEWKRAEAKLLVAGNVLYFNLDGGYRVYVIYKHPLRCTLRIWVL